MALSLVSIPFDLCLLIYSPVPFPPLFLSGTFLFIFFICSYPATDIENSLINYANDRILKTHIFSTTIPIAFSYIISMKYLSVL